MEPHPDQAAQRSENAAVISEFRCKQNGLWADVREVGTPTTIVANKFEADGLLVNVHLRPARYETI